MIELIHFGSRSEPPVILWSLFCLGGSVPFRQMASQGGRSSDPPKLKPAVASLGLLTPRLRELVDDDTGSILSKAGYLSSRTIGNLWDDCDEAALALAPLGIPESLAVSLYNGCERICSNLVDDITRHGSSQSWRSSLTPPTSARGWASAVRCC